MCKHDVHRYQDNTLDTCLFFPETGTTEDSSFNCQIILKLEKNVRILRIKIGKNTVLTYFYTRVVENVACGCKQYVS